MKFSKEVKIGISMVVVLIMTYWGILFLKGLNVLEPKTTYTIVVDDASGMEVSTAVLVRGVKIGSITAINLESVKSNIEVEVTLDSDFDIPNDSYVELFEGSIMSAPKLTIIPGKSNENYLSGDSIQYRFRPSLMQTFDIISSKLLVIFEQVDTIMNGVNQVLSSQNIQNIGETFDNLNKVSNNANNMLISQKDKLNNIMSNFENLSRSLNEATPEVKQILENMTQVTGTVNETLPEMMQQMTNILNNIQSPDGTLGKLLNNDEVYNNLDSSLKNMSILLEDLKLNPKRYVQFSLIQRSTPDEKAEMKRQKAEIKKKKAESKK